MADKKDVESITKICGAQDKNFVRMEEERCEHFDPVEIECMLLKAGVIPDIYETKRCQSIVMYYAEILSKERWDDDGRVTDHEDLAFDAIFEGLHNKSLRQFEEEKGQRYDIAYWHGYIKRAVRNAVLKKAHKDRYTVREREIDEEAESRSDEQRLQRKSFSQTSFCEKDDVLETNLNAKVELSWLVDVLTQEIDGPNTSEKERSLWIRRRSLIINLFHLIRRDKLANEACVKLRKQTTDDKAERERLRKRMKEDRKALMEFFLQKKTRRFEDRDVEERQ